jgi:hypothetical protein
MHLDASVRASIERFISKFQMKSLLYEDLHLVTTWPGYISDIMQGLSRIAGKTKMWQNPSNALIQVYAKQLACSTQAFRRVRRADI